MTKTPLGTCRHCRSDGLDPQATRCPHCSQRVTPWWATWRIVALTAIVCIFSGVTLVIAAKEHNDPAPGTATDGGGTAAPANAAALQDWLDTYRPDLANWADVGDMVMDAWPTRGPRACSDIDMYFSNDMAPDIPEVPNPDLESRLRYAMRAIEYDVGNCAEPSATRADALQMRSDGARMTRAIEAIEAAANTK